MVVEKLFQVFFSFFYNDWLVIFLLWALFLRLTSRHRFNWWILSSKKGSFVDFLFENANIELYTGLILLVAQILEELRVMYALFFDLAYTNPLNFLHFEPINLGRFLSNHSLRWCFWNCWTIWILRKYCRTHIRSLEFGVRKFLQVNGFEIFIWYIREISLDVISSRTGYRPWILVFRMKAGPPSFWNINFTHAWYLLLNRRGRKSGTLTLLHDWRHSLLMMLCLRSYRLVHPIKVEVYVFILLYFNTLLLFRLVIRSIRSRNFLPQLLIHLLARIIWSNMMVDIGMRSRMECCISILLFQGSNRVVGEVGLTAVHRRFSVVRWIHASTWPIERISYSMEI